VHRAASSAFPVHGGIGSSRARNEGQERKTNEESHSSDEDKTVPPERTELSLAEPKAGAGSMEPAEAIKEDPGARVNEAWAESIWSTP
jgi:hypothetical protein